jgi:ATP-dependent DNA helicase RecQ
LVMTETARPVLRGEAQVMLRRDLVSKAARPSAKMLVSEEDAPMLSALKAKRRALAEAAQLPAYMIFPDRTLIEMAERRPQSLDEIARINGVGAKKLERYGAEFLSVLTGQGKPDDMHPKRRKLAGRVSGSLYDALMDAQAGLVRGKDGTEKPLSCSASQIARIAEARPGCPDTLSRYLDDKRATRFGAAFLDVLAQAD